MKKNTTYDLIIVGAGPAGIFTALEFTKCNSGKRVLMIETGKGIEKRKCPKRLTGKCSMCSPCNITSGFSGAGAFSDGKLILSSEVGGMLINYVEEDELASLINSSLSGSPIYNLLCMILYDFLIH